MRKSIKPSLRRAAVQDYHRSGEGFKAVASRHGMSHETLRRFVREAMEAETPVMIARKRVKNPLLPRANRRWNKTEDGMLSEAVASNMTVGEVVELLGRTPAAIMCRKHYLIEKGDIQGFRFKNSERTWGLQDRVGAEQDVDVPELESEDIPVPVVSVTHKEVGETPQLRELAELVRDFGVHITMVVTPEGMEIKMHN
jgi:transposase-like protein